MHRAFSLVFACALVACTFPDVTYAPKDGATAGDDHATPDDGGSTDDARAEGSPADDGPVGDDGTPTDDGPANEGGEAGSCDQDTDTYRAKGGCGGLDCDDLDKDTNPGVTTWVTKVPPASQPLKGDWNCDNKVDHEYAVGVNCGSLLNLTTCNQTAGFTDAALTCGQQGTYVTCMWNVTCQVNTTKPDYQGCL